jgi:hypothetical protein
MTPPRQVRGEQEINPPGEYHYFNAPNKFGAVTSRCTSRDAEEYVRHTHSPLVVLECDQVRIPVLFSWDEDFSEVSHTRL